MKQNFISHLNRHIATGKKTINQGTLPENSPEKLLEKYAAERKRLARSIARKGNYEEIVKNLENQDLLFEQMNRLQQEYESILNIDQANFLFQEDEHSLEIWKALTVLELYDECTFKHSLHTYLIAKSKIESPMLINGQVVDLKKMIVDEGVVDLNQFYKACLLHDIGKIEVPHFLIASEIKNSEWSELLLDFDEKNNQGNPHKLLNKMLTDNGITLPAKIKNYPEITKEQREEKKGLLIKFITENYLRCMLYVPVSAAFNNQLLGLNVFTPQNMQELKKRGYSQDSSLFEIIKPHEKNSKIILENLNLHKEADLVGAHHDYDGLYSTRYEQYPLTISSFALSERTSELLRLADMHEAIHNEHRSYSDSQSRIDCLITLAKSIDKKKIHPLIAYIWLTDELQKIKDSSNHDSEKVATLKKYISTFERANESVN